MTIEQVFQDKTIKAKGKVSTIGEWLNPWSLAHSTYFYLL